MGILSFTGSYGQDFDTLGAAGSNLAWTNGSTLEGWFLFRQPAAGPVATWQTMWRPPALRFTLPLV